jgi:cytochrome c-type biogenesis protein CcmH/NrfG
LDPLREDGWLNLGQQFRNAREFDSAFKAYQHAQTVTGSETPFIAYERALAYIAMGNPQRALDISLSGSD